MWHMPKVENDDVRALAAEIVQREGGYVNDSSDPGGATNFGVTIHTMRRLGLDLTGDGRVSEADVKRLSQAQAVDIFILHYFDKPRIVQLPNAMQASVFDMYVNAGSNAVKILQRMLSKMGFEYNADGAIGPQTIAAAVRAHDYAPDHLSGAIITSVWPVNAPRAVNMRALGQGEKAVGSLEPRVSCPPNITLHRRNFSKGFQHGLD